VSLISEWPDTTAALRTLGYEEGRNFVLEARFADGKVDRLPALAAKLVRLRVDLIFTHGTPATRAAKEATATIPILFKIGVDPVARSYGFTTTSRADPSRSIRSRTSCS
jgi:ABC-type uncharacterized transport system substrate-binding protein